MFSDIPYVDLVPPEKHAAYEYEGFEPGKTVRLPYGHSLREGYGVFSIDTRLDIDCKVPMRDGINIYANVYRPDDGTAAKYPALIAWSPYGKCSGGKGPQNYDSMGPFRFGIPYENLSGYETFEGPNPPDWVRRGYVVVDPDARGACHSEGDICFWGQQEAEDVYDLIQWCTEQKWCDGTAVMFGNSWLAIAQLNHASRCPHPALKAIAPWEAATNAYSDLIARGGVIFKDNFGKMILGGFAGHGKAENIFGALDNRPLYDEYWKSKTIDVAKITIPTYLTASYTSRLHSRASFESFNVLPEKTTWLRVHSSQEWNDLYKDKNMDELQAFYDYFAKGMKNDWPSVPRFRLSLLSMVGSVVRPVEERAETSTTFSLERTKHRKLFFDSEHMTLSTTTPSREASASYEAHSLTDQISYNHKFTTYTELSGLPWVRLYVSCKEHDDMDIHVLIRKIGVQGNLLSYNNYPVPTSVDQLPDLNVCKHQGPNGMLRASHSVSRIPRQGLDDCPRYTHDKQELINPGKIVPLDIPIWPIGMVLGAGEGIQVIVAGHDLKLPEVPTEIKESVDANVGMHHLHTGGKFESFISLPFLEG